MLSRLSKLYDEGGITEINRGFRDWLITNTDIPLWKLYNEATLRSENVDVAIQVNSREDLWRAGGHGERDVQADFVDVISPSDVVWDVGANIGTYSLLAASLGARVEAFEPGEIAHRKLLENAELNGLSLSIHNFALGSKNRNAILEEASRSGVRQLNDEGSGDTVQVRRGDSLDLDQPDVVKIDVEGAELDVIRGMEDQLGNSETVFVEVDDADEMDHVVDSLERIGLTVTSGYDRSILRADS